MCDSEKEEVLIRREKSMCYVNTIHYRVQVRLHQGTIMKTGSKLSEDEIQLYNAFVASKKAQPVARITLIKKLLVLNIKF